MAVSKPVIRQATLEDCDKIVSIDSEGRIYDGLDYIPGWVRVILQDKASNGIVGEVDGRVVGFRILYVIEDGTKAISMSGRTVRNYRGKGIFAQLRKHTKQTLSKKYPKLNSTLYTTALDDLPAGEDFIIKENFFSQHATVDDLKRNLSSQPLVEMGRSSHMLSPENAVTLMTDDTIRQRFFNQEYINAYVMWWPVKTNKLGMTHLALRHNVAASFANISVSPPLIPQDVTAISFSDLTRGVNKFCLDVFFHGTDIDLLKDHLLTHLRKAVTVAYKGAFGIKFHFPLAMNNHKDEVDRFLKQAFHCPTTWGRRLYVIGQELPFIPQSQL